MPDKGSSDSFGLDGSFDNRKSLSKSKMCGCFSCLEVFAPIAILNWIDGGITALCPRCGVDSVLGDASEDISPERLKLLKQHWFNDVEPLA